MNISLRYATNYETKIIFDAYFKTVGKLLLQTAYFKTVDFYHVNLIPRDSKKFKLEGNIVLISTQVLYIRLDTSPFLLLQRNLRTHSIFHFYDQCRSLNTVSKNAMY